MLAGHGAWDQLLDQSREAQGCRRWALATACGAGPQPDRGTEGMESTGEAREHQPLDQESLSPNGPDAEEPCMASGDPKCPDCDGPIGADWDWCMHCGYDPDHLKPWDWRPSSGGGMGGSVQTATAPGQVGLIDLTEKKRRKRSERSKRKGRGRDPEHAEPQVATMASTSSLISLPARPAVQTTTPRPRTDPRPAAPGPAMAPTAPAPSAPAPPAPPPAARQ